MIPTSKNKPPVESPWLIICSTEPVSPWWLSANMPSITKPRWLTEEYATSFFMSFCAIATSAP